MRRFDSIYAKLARGELNLSEVDWPQELAMIGLEEAMVWRRQAEDHPLLSEIVDILRANDTLLVPVRNLLADLLVTQASRNATELKASRAATFGGDPDAEGEPSG
ncbi:hypothetical protein [uncultured Mediterranean phage uvDeep-CGR2-KM19-C37]|nr:hypothetical protein [uncultured Mediterranean phage uvDeep-CGR2-KM19-C37]